MGQVSVARPKGTRDLLPDQTSRWRAAEEIAHRVFSSYGYGEIRTPALEATELFARSVGESTDIVHKEMFTFTDRGGRSLTLRPENTAGVVRAVIENGLAHGPMPLRLYYVGPQYRYERPQKGRYREFRQIGAEFFGASGPEADAELLAMLFDFLRALGFRNLSVSINAVPSAMQREGFSAAIREFSRGLHDRFGEDDRRRLEENPLRLFDSKDPETLRALEGAPGAIEFLDTASRAHHDEVLRLLAQLKIPFVENPRLVRGLDYYTRTVFEVTSSDLGAQDAILGGGRYDELVAELGGPHLPAVGFAIGEDRLVDVMPLATAGTARRIRVIPFGAEQAAYALKVAVAMRQAGTGAIVDLDVSGRGFKKALGTAAELGFQEAIIVGSAEVDAGTATVRNLLTREQRTVPLSELK